MLNINLRFQSPLFSSNSMNIKDFINSLYAFTYKVYSEEYIG